MINADTAVIRDVQAEFKPGCEDFTNRDKSTSYLNNQEASRNEVTPKTCRDGICTVVWKPVRQAA